MIKTNKKVKLNVRVNKTRRKEKSPKERFLSDEEFIPGFEDKVEHIVENYVDRVEKTKRFTLIVGVSFFMILIFSFYAFSFKTQMINLDESDQNEVGIDGKLIQIKADIGEAIENYVEIKDSLLEEIDSTENMQKSELGDGTPKATLPVAQSSEEIDKDSVEILKERLLLEDVSNQ